jgi:hypothetical protein
MNAVVGDLIIRKMPNMHSDDFSVVLHQEKATKADACKKTVAQSSHRMC